MHMSNGCEAKDPAVKEWTRGHEGYHEAIEERLRDICTTIKWHSKIIWALGGAVAVLVSLIVRNPQILLTLLRGG